MKKLSFSHKVWLARHARRAHLRRIVEKDRRHERRTGHQIKRAVGYRDGTRRKIWVSAKPDPVPALLCFDRNFEETAAFIERATTKLCQVYAENRNRIRSRRTPVGWHDFASLEEITPGAALVLAAEYDRVRMLYGAAQMYAINVDDWQAQPRDLLRSLGFFDLLGIEAPPVRPDEMRTIVRFRSDTNVNMAVASHTLIEVIELAASAAIIGVGQDPLKEFRTFLQAIGEALNNTSDHAYPDNLPTDFPNVGRWWITGAVDLDARRLTFAVYDQGVTIPRAIPYGRRFERVRRIVQTLTRRGYDPDDRSLDGHAIAAAVRSGVSGTGLDHRGRGLGLMRDYIRNERSGRLRIVSRNGEFVACTGRKDEYRTRSVPLHGTFVEWIVDL